MIALGAAGDKMIPKQITPVAGTESGWYLVVQASENTREARH